MYEGLAFASVGAAALGAGLLALLYRRPDSRPLVRSGYTVAAVVVSFLAVAGALGSIVMPARSSSRVVAEAMQGVVEGYYFNATLLGGAHPRGGALDLLASRALRSLGSTPAARGGGRCSPDSYPLVVIHLYFPRSTGAPPGPGLAMEAYLIVDPRLGRGTAYYIHSGGHPSVAASLEEAGLRVRGGLGGSGDPVLERLSSQCGDPLECLAGASPLTSPGGVEVETQASGATATYEAVLSGVQPPRTPGYVEVAVNPSDARAALQAIARSAGALGGTLDLSTLPAEVYSVIVADIPDACYSRATPGTAYYLVRASLSRAAPPGYSVDILPQASARLSMLSKINSMSRAGSLLGLVIVASVIAAAAQPLAASGAVSLARSVALLRLRGYTPTSLKRRLAMASAASLLAGGAAGILVAEGLSGGLEAYAGHAGVYAAVGLAAAALLVMYRRAYREASSVYLEAAARGSPLASLPPRPPGGLGKTGWLGLALGVYHAVRGYMGFTTAGYLSSNWEKVSSLNPAVQALLGVWAFLEAVTAPFAPALLAYGSARLLAWKAPAMASSKAVRALLGGRALAAYGMARLVSGRAVALVTLAVLATGLAAASALAGPAASGWASRAAAAAVSPGLLAVKPVAPSQGVAVNYTLAYTGPSGAAGRNGSATLTLYNVSKAVLEARRACPRGIVAVGLPAVRAALVYGKAGGGGELKGRLVGLYTSAALEGAPRPYMLLVFQDSRGALELFERAGVELSSAQVEALLTPARSLLYPEPGTVSGTEGGAGFWILSGPSLEAVHIPNRGWVGVEAAPGAEVAWWYAGMSRPPLGGPGGPRVFIMGSWAFHYVDRVVGYPAGSPMRPVVVVYTLDGGCRGPLVGAGFHVYSPSDLYGSEEFRRASRILGAVHPSSFLAPAALASSALALASAVLLALDADREVRPFMALLRLRGAGRGDGLRMSLALWGVFLASSTAVGLLAGLGAALGALGLVTDMAGGAFTYRVPARLPDGVPVTVVFTGSQARVLGFSWASLAGPAALGLALLAPLLLVTMRVFRGPVGEWVR